MCVKFFYQKFNDLINLGEKYLGLWNNDMKHGCGLIVTLDGIYYEGVFQQDIMMVKNYLYSCLIKCFI